MKKFSKGTRIAIMMILALIGIGFTYAIGCFFVREDDTLLRLMVGGVISLCMGLLFIVLTPHQK